jgi:hypothetical protein
LLSPDRLVAPAGAAIGDQNAMNRLKLLHTKSPPPTTRHPDESRGLLNSLHAISAAQISLIHWVPAFAGMTGGGESAKPSLVIFLGDSLFCKEQVLAKAT